MTRRLATTVAASLTALVLLAVPALAGSSFTSGAEAPADSDHGLTLTITEPDDEDYDNTSRVTVVAPSSFTVIGCQQEVTWTCTADDSSVTFDRTALGALGDDTLQFSVRTPATNGTYTFQVTQADGAEEPATVGSSPTVTVTGGTDPPPPQDDGGGDGGTEDGGTDDGGSDDSSGGDTSDATSDGDTDDTSDDTAPEDSGAADDDANSPDDTSSETGSDSDDGTSSSGGSTTPRSTEGRSNGTSLQITPGESTADDPAISAPDVADDPAVAPPSDDDGTDDAETGTATMTAIEGQAGDEQDAAGGLPWQQLLGAMLLVAGGAVVAVRRWDVLDRVRGWDPLGRIRRWRS